MQRDPWGFIRVVEDAPWISPLVRRKNRVCAFDGCDTPLSISNASTGCCQHDTMRVFAMPGP